MFTRKRKKTCMFPNSRPKQRPFFCLKVTTENQIWRVKIHYNYKEWPWLWKSLVLLHCTAACFFTFSYPPFLPLLLRLHCSLYICLFFFALPQVYLFLYLISSSIFAPTSLFLPLSRLTSRFFLSVFLLFCHQQV